MEQALYDALKVLRNQIPRLADLLQLGDDEAIGFWKDMVDAKLLSRLAPDFPIVAAICGGGSSGKSTLFNSLVGENFAPTGGTAGLNRRVLFSIPARRAEQIDFLADLARPFGDVPQPLNVKEELTIPGKPLYVLNHSNSNNLVLLDTPDFDTGAKGSYTNREVTRMALEAADILIYIFTNSNYNNRDNTDFIAQMLTGIGKRKCFLVYRVYPSFTEREVLEHAMTVARGIYGELADHYLLGVYRTDEDNNVAAGRRFMKLKPAHSKEPAFMQVLQSLDAPKIRIELYSSILNDVCQRAGMIKDRAEVSLDKLRLYYDTLQMAQSHCIREALKHFPMDRIMRRFARIWAATDPTHVKIMRRTGSVIEFPLKMLLGAAGWAKNQISPPKSRPSSKKEYVQKLDEDLVTAVTGLHNQAVSPQIAVISSLNDPASGRLVGTIEAIKTRQSLAQGQNPRVETSGEGAILNFVIDVHPVVVEEQDRLRAREFKYVLQSILAEKEIIVGISSDMEKDLKDLADQFREKMGVWRKISQTFWAFLNVLPATAAVTYVLSTGDPVGAAGIKVKLAGLFGVKDLYALFAIPFTTGLKKADRQQIEEMLGHILQTWLKDKSQKVQHLFEEKLTGGILRCARRNIADAERLISTINNLLLTCTEGSDKQ
ncbi:MAG: 50S ribosome-binding GTPase [Desulfobacterales bacterium]|nr:MAG: 50S ribosome-binding GTPase [Desulfobacterales bacterium]